MYRKQRRERPRITRLNSYIKADSASPTLRISCYALVNATSSHRSEWQKTPVAPSTLCPRLSRPWWEDGEGSLSTVIQTLMERWRSSWAGFLPFNPSADVPFSKCNLLQVYAKRTDLCMTIAPRCPPELLSLACIATLLMETKTHQTNNANCPHLVAAAYRTGGHTQHTHIQNKLSIYITASYIMFPTNHRDTILMY